MKCQLNLPRSQDRGALLPVGGNGAVAVAGAKMGGQQVEAD